MIRRYDKGLAEYLTLFLEGQRVPLTFATPRREETLIPGTNTEQKGVDFPPTEFEFIDLPATTLARYDAQFATNRWQPYENRNIVYTEDLNQVMTALHPLPYDFSYQYEIWTKYWHDMNCLMEEYARKFPKPVWCFPVTFPPEFPFGTRNIHIRNEGGFSANVMYEDGEAQRVLRFVGSITLEGWIPLHPKWKRTVKKFGISVIEESSGEIIEEFITEYADNMDFWCTGNQNQRLDWV